jgi:SAM-dependent methyltransferase
MSIGRRLRDVFRPVFPGLFVLAKGLGLLYSPRSFLRTSGYLRSVRSNRPCRADGSPMPWMNYAMVAFLEQRLRPEMSLFEFGSGNSTLFFARHVGKVVSVEIDPAWHERVAKQMPAGVKLILCSPFDEGRYVATLVEQATPFDVIVVDAAARESCLAECWRWLTPGGVILLDDSSRPRYQEAIEGVLARGFRKLDFLGLKPGGIRAYQSTLFYRDGNVFGI